MVEQTTKHCTMTCNACNTYEARDRVVGKLPSITTTACHVLRLDCSFALAFLFPRARTSLPGVYDLVVPLRLGGLDRPRRRADLQARVPDLSGLVFQRRRGGRGRGRGRGRDRGRLGCFVVAVITK